VAGKTEIQKLRAEIETARGEVARKRRKPPAPKQAAAPETPAPDSGASESGASAAFPPGLEGVDLQAMLTKAEDALANLDEDISRHPRLAVLGALAVGLIIGSLLSR
jgi:hypothetical protein